MLHHIASFLLSFFVCGFQVFQAQIAKLEMHEMNCQESCLLKDLLDRKSNFKRVHGSGKKQQTEGLYYLTSGASMGGGWSSGMAKTGDLRGGRGPNLFSVCCLFLSSARSGKQQHEIVTAAGDLLTRCHSQLLMPVQIGQGFHL